MKNLLKYIFLGLAVSFLAGCGDSGSKKWRLDNKELTADEVANLKIAIAFRDEIIQKNEWAKLNGDFWSDILVFFPEEAKRCRELKGFEKFDGSNWANLLAEEPRFEKDCEKNRGWEAISPKDWIKLLKKQPNYLSKAKQLNAFERIYSRELVRCDFFRKFTSIEGMRCVERLEDVESQRLGYVVKKQSR